MMQKEKIGNVWFYSESGETADTAMPPDIQQAVRQMEEIIRSCKEEDYHAQITGRRNYTVMYQLAESRANIVEWLHIPQHAKVLELGAGCGAIASALLKKGAGVTCQEENPAFARLNALRHQQLEDGRLTVYAMPYEQCEPHLADDYDMAVLVQLPAANGESQKLLGNLRRHLKPDGILVLATENKFGLKYWAGNKEPHTHRYFSGLEQDGVCLYSRTGIQKLLASAGFGWQEFYYPYPGHLFALDIFSDRHLPKKGDLAYSIANYEDDRLILFDEQKVFDSIIEEGQFPFFSNSYLCLAGMGSPDKQCQETVYARYAADRSRKFAVRTGIAGGRVWKYPIYPEGAAHILHMEQAYQQLSRQYAHTGLKFNRCIMHTAASQAPDGKAVAAEFEFIHGEALQEQARQAIAAGSLKKVFDILHQMVQYIRNGRNSRPFEMTPEFRSVFGETAQASVLEHAACSGVSDIDLILPNILVADDGTWHVIDYEWTFFFPVPQNFMIYRTLFFLHQENPQHKELSMEALLQETGIPAQEAQVYEQMEQGFQQYVTGGLVPYREMVNLLERRFMNIAALEAEYDRVMAENELLKGKGIWKAARKIKKKLTGN